MSRVTDAKKQRLQDLASLRLGKKTRGVSQMIVACTLFITFCASFVWASFCVMLIHILLSNLMVQITGGRFFIPTPLGDFIVLLSIFASTVYLEFQIIRLLGKCDILARFQEKAQSLQELYDQRLMTRQNIDGMLTLCSEIQSLVVQTRSLKFLQFFLQKSSVQKLLLLAPKIAKISYEILLDMRTDLSSHTEQNIERLSEATQRIEHLTSHDASTDAVLSAQKIRLDMQIAAFERLRETLK